MAKGAKELCGKAVSKLPEQVADRRFLPQAQNDPRELNVEIVTENGGEMPDEGIPAESGC